MNAQLNKTWTMGLFFLLVLFLLVLCNVQKLNKMTEETSGCVDKVLFYEQLELPKASKKGKSSNLTVFINNELYD